VGLLRGETIELHHPGVRAEVFVSPLNQRLRVLGYETEDHAALARALVRLARRHEVSKVYLKALPRDAAPLGGVGFVEEGLIRGYFDGVDAVVMSHFLDASRGQSSASREEQEALEALAMEPVPDRDLVLPDGYEASRAGPGDAEELARLYETVFGSYPFPIFDPAYLREVMASHVVYLTIRDGEGSLVAAASAETDAALRSAEMTDFATLPSQRGKGLAMFLLEGLEVEMENAGIPNLYTLARSSQLGMNKVFHHLGYAFTGRLIKNCYIAGAFEDMLCWCKSLG
jgi:putative beta-lysine N-acetyltransferase